MSAPYALLDKSQTRSLNLNQIEVKGGDSYSQEFFQTTFQPLLHTKDVTFQRLVSSIDECTANLERSGLFSNINVTIDTDVSVISAAKAAKPFEEPIPVKAVFHVDEVSIKAISPNMTVTNDNLRLGLWYMNNNINGNGEQLSAAGFASAYTDSKFANLMLTTPLQKRPETSSLFMVNALSEASTSVQSTQQSGLMGFKSKHSDYFSSFFGLSLSARSFVNTTEEIPDAIRKDMGTSSKTSMFLNGEYNSVAYDATFPATGLSVSMHNCIDNCIDSAAQLNYKTLKTELGLNYYKSFPCHNFATFQLHGNVGNLTTMNQANQSLVHFHDKFAASDLHGLGSDLVSERKDTVYGSSIATVGSSLSCKLPYLFKLDTPVRFSVFGNVNKLGDALSHTSVSAESLKSVASLQALNENFLVNYGLGLKYQNGAANFDISYVMSNQKYASTFRPGLQFNFSLVGVY
ncbi:hypothetical protein BABINDRAFT_163742 [Babjeviella inositovora NRRL Y-12698]|uniref:Bacterial surface antigen (D15) domain-containing protein n=1 Tax=Babjeviella inositovora NRRL Y-12698 TaxID=984486 RepID=A0A1E3QHS2_9ASCO|nr:uncharacterized protein BABINDRAFT_163742 [Babjeviella inositovora NRRL Y-12698]ODQ77241.1 hypothetical protein BABINDRAFT_163742 [Babjeviella inositovora NRRL Y-12698]